MNNTTIKPPPLLQTPDELPAKTKQEASQVAHPRQAVKRTLLALLSGVALLPVILLAISEAFTIITGEASGLLPESFATWMIGAGAALITLSTVITRILAIPAVNDWLTKFNLAADPKPAPDKDTV